MASILSRMSVGIAGDVSRPSATVESMLIDSGAPPTRFGQFVKLVSGKLQPATLAGDVSILAGLSVRPFPSPNPAGTSQGMGAGSPPASGILDVMRRGYMTVVAKGTGAITKGSAVYLCTTAGGAMALGDIVVAASPGSSAAGTAVPGATFQGPADAQGNVEIAFNL